MRIPKLPQPLDVALREVSDRAETVLKRGWSSDHTFCHPTINPTVERLRRDRKALRYVRSSSVVVYRHSSHLTRVGRWVLNPHLGFVTFPKVVTICTQVGDARDSVKLTLCETDEGASTATFASAVVLRQPSHASCSPESRRPTGSNSIQKLPFHNPQAGRRIKSVRRHRLAR